MPPLGHEKAFGQLKSLCVGEEDRSSRLRVVLITHIDQSYQEAKVRTMRMDNPTGE
jgi:hypothetical protein